MAQAKKTKFTQHQRSIETLALLHGNPMQLFGILMSRSASLQSLFVSFTPSRKPGTKSHGRRSMDTTCSVWRWSEGFSSCLEPTRRSCECFRHLVTLWRTLRTSQAPLWKSCWRPAWVPSQMNNWLYFSINSSPFYFLWSHTFLSIQRSDLTKKLLYSFSFILFFSCKICWAASSLTELLMSVSVCLFICSLPGCCQPSRGCQHTCLGFVQQGCISR